MGRGHSPSCRSPSTPSVQPFDNDEAGYAASDAVRLLAMLGAAR